MTKIPIKSAGLYLDLPADAYHADPCATPSLSRSIAVTLLQRSPRHAWCAHPRLNPAFEPSQAKRFDLGSAVHDLMLGEPDRFMVVKSDSFRGFAAQRKRDAARKIGLIPMLQADLERAKHVVDAARAQLAGHPEASDAFIDGRAEATLIWTETVPLESGKKFKVWCRARPDWMQPGSPIFYDLKTTETSAHPDAWSSMLFREWLDVQAAFYRRGIVKVLKLPRDDVKFRFVVVEVTPPHALSVVELDGMSMEFADRKVDAALSLWAECMSANQWPGYPNRIAYVQPPAWAEKSWIDREDRDHQDRSDGRHLFERMIRWQAPLHAQPKGNQ